MSEFECACCHHIVVARRPPTQCGGCGSFTCPWLGERERPPFLARTIAWLKKQAARW